MLHKYILIGILFASTICYSQVIYEGMAIPSYYNKIKRDVRNKISYWLEKEEFEKTKQYQVRTTSQFSKAFDSICYEVVSQAIENKPALRLQLLKYNADTEKLGISVEFDGKKWDDSLQVPINRAPAFKEADGFRTMVNNADWLLADGYLIPEQIQLQSKFSTLYLLNPTKNGRFIEFSTNEFGIATPGNKTYMFNYNYLKSVVTHSKYIVYSSGHSSDETLLNKVKIEASVNIPQWRRHLENQMRRYIEDAANAGMAPGNYTVNIRFLVEKDGSINSVQALNDPGYGLAPGAVELMKRRPKWTPGEQNGKKVRSYHTQPITFQIHEQ